MIDKIKSKFNKNRLPLLLVLILVGIFAFGGTALADGDTSGQVNFLDGLFSGIGATFNGLSELLIGSFTLIYNIGTFLVLAIVYFVGWFLSPDFYTGEIASLKDFFEQIWIVISNFVYLFFAGLLIWIAFVNIIGREGSNFQLKTVLPKFVLSVLMVPFTKFIVSFTLSFVAIASQAVLALPDDLLASQKRDGTITPRVFNYKNVEKVGVDAFRIDEGAEEIKIKGELGKNPYLVVWKYFDSTVSLPKSANITESDFKQNFTKFIISTFLAIAFIVSTFGLLLVLIYRVIWIWIFTIFSPIFAVSFFFGGQGALETISFKRFLSTAFVPVYVSLALSFGFIFMAKISDSSTYEKGSTLDSIVTDSEGATYKNGEFILNIKGDFFDNFNAGLGDSADTVQDFIIKLFIQIFGVVIFRMGIMAALKTDKLTGTVIEPIANIGKSLGEAFKALPKYTPIPLTGGLSLHAMDSLSNTPINVLTANSTQKANIMTDSLKAKFHAKDAITDAQMTEMRTILNEKNVSPEEVQKVVDLIIETQEEYGKDNVSLRKLKRMFFDDLERNKSTSKYSRFINERQRKAGITNNAVFYKDGEITTDGYKLLLGTSITGEVDRFRNIRTTKRPEQAGVKDRRTSLFKGGVNKGDIRTNIKTEDSSELVFHSDYNDLSKLNLEELTDGNTHVLALKDKVKVFDEGTVITIPINEETTKLNSNQLRKLKDLNISDNTKAELLNRLGVNITADELNSKIRDLGNSNK